MPKRPPAKYNPGELDKTRKNLGNLSMEETKKMTSLLGGEIGVEKSNPAIEKRYEKLKSQNTTGYIVGDTNLPSNRVSNNSDTYAKKETKRKQKKNTKKKKNKTSTSNNSWKKRKLSYFERITLDQVAVRPEHKIKAKSDMFFSYISFLIKTRDRVNPDFINNCDKFFYTNVNSLITSLEALLKIIRPAIFKAYINPYYRNIYKIILNWKPQEMNNMLTSLQKNPRRVEVYECGTICKALYRPLFLLRNCDVVHIYAAIERLYKILVLIFADNPKQIDFIKNNYLDIRENIELVFLRNPNTCCPLLLKLTETKYTPYNELINTNDSYILKFIGITPDQTLDAPASLDEARRQEYSLNHLKIKLEKEKEKALEKMKEQRGIRTESEIEPSINFLDKMFPRSNWKKYKEFPDFYPYFQPIFKFPRGTELISQEDPLQQAIILVTIIGELLYGFRGIKINSETNNVIERIINKWNLFMDNIIRNYYVKNITEYCRYIEKDSVSHTTKFAQKLVTDINWFKTKFIFPFLKFKTIYKTEVASINSPKLYEQTAFFYNSLKTLLEEFDNSPNKASVVENYNEPFNFEIKNTTSNRLKKVLKQENIKPTNENLLRYCFLVVSLLDFLINTKSSAWYYTDADKIPLFRKDPDNNDKPQYSVPLRKTRTILARL